MAARAVRSFRAQTYANKRLLIVNSGHHGPITTEAEQSCEVGGIIEPCFVGIDGWTIGQLRNHACKYASHHYTTSDTRPEIFAHFDDDDLSHPARIAEQVALLTASGADCVGYQDMLFWRSVSDICYCKCAPPSGALIQCANPRCHETWLYAGGTPNYILGTSMMYTRKAWERRPFLNESAGVEEKWCRDSGLNIVAVSSLPTWSKMAEPAPSERWKYEPRMIASIHGANTSTGYNIEEYVRLGSQQWKRAPEFDSYCREAMKL